MPAKKIKVTKEYIHSIRSYMLMEMISIEALADRAKMSEKTLRSLLKHCETSLNTVKKLKNVGIEPQIDVLKTLG